MRSYSTSNNAHGLHPYEWTDKLSYRKNLQCGRDEGQMPTIQGCCMSSSGAKRAFLSHLKQPSKKFTNIGSLHPMAVAILLVPGQCFLPHELGTILGLLLLSKNIFLREACSRIVFEGIPKTSIMHASCSTSFSPGKRGYPEKSSARMHPKLQMSIIVS